MAVLTQSLMRKGSKSNIYFSSTRSHTYFWFQKGFLFSSKEKNKSTKRGLTWLVVHFNSKEKKNGIWSRIAGAWKCKSFCFLYETFKKNPLTTFHLVFSLTPSLCPPVLPCRRHSHRMKITLKRPFYASTPALNLLQMFTIKKHLPELCQEINQRSDIFRLFPVTGHHAHLVPS